MRKPFEAQMTIEDHEFLEMGSFFPKDEQLEKMSVVLDENPQILEEVAGDLCAGLQQTGKHGMSVEQVLRSAIIYQIKAYSFRELEARLGDSFNFRKFTSFYARKIPHYTDFEKAFKKIRPETFEIINDLLVAHAIKKKLEDGKKLRGDTAVVESNIHHPTDSTLLWDGVRVLDRLMAGAVKNCPSAIFEYHKRTKVSKKLCYKITMAKGKKAEKTRAKCYRELLRYSREVLAMAKACRAALSGVCDFHEKDAAVFLGGEMDNYIPLMEKSIAQCERRVLQGEKVPASEKIVSIFEPHTDVICRGKTMSPAEFGHKVLITSGASCLITQYKVCEGNPGDNELFQNLLEKHVEQFGKCTEAFAGDRRFYSSENERLAADDPFNVELVSIPKPGYRSSKRRAFEDKAWFKKLQRFRAGIEGGLSTLIRCFGLDRCLWRGFASFKSWVGLSVFAYNLRKIAVLG